MAHTVFITSRESEEIFVGDSIYVNEWSLSLDLKITLQSSLIVTKGEGLY